MATPDTLVSANSNLYRRSKGEYEKILITGKTKQEVIDWRNFFYNLGAITLTKYFQMAPEEALDAQEEEIEELAPGTFSLTFHAPREKIIKAFETAEELKAPEIPQGKKLRRKFHREIEPQFHARAVERFEAIPTLSML